MHPPSHETKCPTPAVLMPPHNLIRDERCVLPHAADQRRRHAMLQAESHEVKPGHGRHHAALMARTAVRIQRRNVQPTVIRVEPRAPDDDGGIEHVRFAHGKSGALAGESPNPNDPGVLQILLVDPDQPVAATAHPIAKATAQSGVERRPCQHRPDPVEEISVQQPARQMTGASPGQPDFPDAGELERDLCAGVPRPHDQHRAIWNVERISVVARVELPNARRDLPRDVRDLRPLKRSRGDDQAVGFERAIVGAKNEPFPIVGERMHGYAEPDG